jgi:hypothetical protein
VGEDPGRVALARLFAETLLTAASGLLDAIMAADGALAGAEAALKEVA